MKMLQNRILIVALACSLSLVARAETGGGSGAVNGGGIAEQNIAFAYANLEYFITLCLSSNVACRLQSSEAEILQKEKLQFSIA